MSKTKLQLTIINGLVLFFLIVGCSPKETSKIDYLKVSETDNQASQKINTRDVELVNRVGGLPFSKWKVIFVPKDNLAIDKIVTMVNSNGKADFDASDYGRGKEVGYPVSINIKLQNGNTWCITPLFKVVSVI